MRHKEFEQVFKRLYKSLGEQQPDLIVIAGDIVHSKTQISPELIGIVHKFFKKLSKIAPCIVITGNHDANLSNLERIDAISPVLNLSKIKNVHYLRDTGIYTYGNIDFYVFSVFSKANKYPSKKDIIDENAINIALFHGPLALAQTETKYRIRDSVVKANSFRGFDIAMLGDIHKRQYLNTQKTIAYPGSLIQQNYGEKVDKGYLMWDIETRISEFIPVHNDYAFYTIATINGKLPDNLERDVTALHPRIRLFVDTKTIQDKELIEQDITARFNPSELLTQPKDISHDTSIKDLVKIENFSNLEVQDNLIATWLLTRYPELDNDFIGEVLEINGEMQYRYETRHPNIPEYSVWTLKKLEFENLFSYSTENKIDFSKFDGITGIFGSNTSGKSSIFEILCFALFGQTGKQLKNVDILNIRKKTANVTVTFSAMGVDYEIRRTLRQGYPGTAHANLDFFRVQDDIKQSLRGDDIWETQRKINAIIGTWENFITTSINIQGQGNPFIYAKDSKRKEIVNSFVGLDIFDEKYSLANEDNRDTKVLLKEYKLTDHKTAVRNYTSDIAGIDSSIQRYEKDIQNVKEKAESLQTEADKKRAAMRAVHMPEETIQYLRTARDDIKVQIRNTKTEILEYERDLNKQIKEFDKVEIQLSKVDFKELTKKVKAYEKNKISIAAHEVSLDKLRVTVRNKLGKVKILKSEPWHLEEDLCKGCSFMTDTFAAQKELKEHVQETDLALKESKRLKEQQVILKKYYDIEEHCIALKTNRASLSADVNRRKLILNNFYKTVELEKSRLQLARKEVDEYNKNKSRIEYNKKLKYELELLDQDILDKKDVIDSLVEIFDVKKSELNILEHQRDTSIDAIKKIDKLETKFNAYKYYLEAIHRNSIPYEILEKTLPQINHQINHVLESITDFTIEIVSVDDKLRTYIKYSDKIKFPVEAGSGMEKVMAGIAMRVALLNISRNPQPSTFVIDEGFSELDQENFNSLYAMFQYLKTKFKNVIIISHIAALKDVVDQNIEVRKDSKGFSYFDLREI